MLAGVHHILRGNVYCAFPQWMMSLQLSHFDVDGTGKTMILTSEKEREK